MSVILPRYRPLQQFFRSGPAPCPYLPGLVERKLFTRLNGVTAQEVNSTLSRAGFRRSHDVVYRPVCHGCSACVPIRVPVGGFCPNRTQKRIKTRNSDLNARIIPAAATAEQFRLFSAYQASRHGDGDMSRMTFPDYVAMIEEGRVDSVLLQVTDATETLRGVMLADRLDDGFSAVYSFFDPIYPSRSLGTHLILSLIETTFQAGLPYTYLGYWINGSAKMAYKARFRPFEILGRCGWEAQNPVPNEV